VISHDTTVAPLDLPELRQAAALLARAMSTNPMHLAVFGRPCAVAERRQAEMFAIVLREFPGQKLGARRDRELTGVLRMVRSPLCRLPAAEAARLRPLLVTILGHAAPRVAQWFRVWAERDPPTAHWHLGPLAVAEAQRGRGIGSALLRGFCDRVDAAGEPACLETDRRETVRLYERFGFAVREEVPIFGVSNFFMWREAR
jgi:GNAT superfamily N-acetyltransferase